MVPARTLSGSSLGQLIGLLRTCAERCHLVREEARRLPELKRRGPPKIERPAPEHRLRPGSGGPLEINVPPSART